MQYVCIIGRHGQCFTKNTFSPGPVEKAQLIPGFRCPDFREFGVEFQCAQHALTRTSLDHAAIDRTGVLRQQHVGISKARPAESEVRIQLDGLLKVLGRGSQRPHRSLIEHLLADEIRLKRIDAVCRNSIQSAKIVVR